ncbi:glutamate receptor-like [Periplaneta americana]|uniref:glutamate receptor-like n=1 Tax=Periplaneta americana TaxID=6978 RepID=UPI0037E75B6C
MAKYKQLTFYSVLLISVHLICVQSCEDSPQLVACAEAISNLHFSSGRTLVASLLKTARAPNTSKSQDKRFLFNPATTDVTESSLRNLHSYTQWPIMVSSARNFTNSYTLRDKPDSYIFWTTGSSIEEQIQSLECHRDSWNSRARFLVVVTKYIRDIGSVLKDFFDSLRRRNVLDVVIVVPNMNQNLDVYSWNPFEVPSGNCGIFSEAILLDKWVTDPNGHFLKNISLYKRNSRLDVQRCPITASTISFPPHVMLDDKTSDYTNGLDIKLLRFVTKAINASVIFLPPSPELWGEKLENGTWTGIVGDVFYKRADVGFCCYMLVLNKALDMDFTTPYATTNFDWVVPCAKPYPPWSSITRVFSPTVWLLVFLAVSVSAIVMLFLSVSRKSLSQEVTLYTDMAGCFSSSWALLLGVSVFKSPTTAPVRIFFIFWLSYCMSINTVFQTFVTSFLVDPGLKKQINSVKDLLDSGIQYGYHTDIDTFVPHAMNSLKGRRKICSNIASCMERVALKQDFATVVSRETVQYKKTYSFVDDSGKVLVCTIRNPAFTAHRTFYLSRGSIYTDVFNTLIQIATEAGLVDYWWKDILTASKIKAAVIRRSMRQEEYLVLELKHLQGAFYLLLIGYCISVLSFVSEILSHKRKKNK